MSNFATEKMRAAILNITVGCNTCAHRNRNPGLLSSPICIKYPPGWVDKPETAPPGLVRSSSLDTMYCADFELPRDGPWASPSLLKSSCSPSYGDSQSNASTVKTNTEEAATARSGGLNN